MRNDEALKVYFMTQKNEHFRSLLTSKQLELTETANKTKEDSEPIELDQSRIGRLSRMDAMQVQAMSSAVAQRRTFELKRIESALQRIDEGDYGFCLQCGDEIELTRLELDPSSPKCMACAKASEH